MVEQETKLEKPIMDKTLPPKDADSSAIEVPKVKNLKVQKDDSIVVFPGTFNPIHDGHKIIIEGLSINYEKLILAVLPFDIIGKSKTYTDYEERRKLVESFVKDKKFDNVEVLSINPSDYKLLTYYSILSKIKENNPNKKIILAIGGDVIKELITYPITKKIFKDFDILAIGRKKYDEYYYIDCILHKIGKDYDFSKCSFIDFGCPDISSTEIRNESKKGIKLETVKEKVPKKESNSKNITENLQK